MFIFDVTTIISYNEYIDFIYSLKSKFDSEKKYFLIVMILRIKHYGIIMQKIILYLKINIVTLDKL